MKLLTYLKMVVGIPFAPNTIQDFMFVIFYDRIDVDLSAFGKIPDLANHFCTYRSVEFKDDSLGCDNQQYIGMEKLDLLFLCHTNLGTS